jgi:hypothetical protein
MEPIAAIGISRLASSARVEKRSSEGAHMTTRTPPRSSDDLGIPAQPPHTARTHRIWALAVIILAAALMASFSIIIVQRIGGSPSAALATAGATFTASVGMGTALVRFITE